MCAHERVPRQKSTAVIGYAIPKVVGSLPSCEGHGLLTRPHSKDWSTGEKAHRTLNADTRHDKTTPV